MEASQESKLCEFYFEWGLAQKNFRAEANKKFDLKKFRKASIRIIYDSLHGISADAIPLSNAVEIMAYCLVDGKVEQESEFETDLYNELVKQLTEMKDDLKKWHDEFSIEFSIDYGPYSTDHSSLRSTVVLNRMFFETVVESSKTNIGINLALSANHWCSSWTFDVRRRSMDIWSQRFWKSLHFLGF